MKTREESIKYRENIMDGRDALRAHGMSEELAPFLDYTDSEEMEKSIDRLKHIFESAVNEVVKSRFGSEVDNKRSSGSNDSYTVDDIRDMMRR